MKINNCETKNDFCMKFLLTNARSLAPKIDSLLDAFGSLGLQFAGITETWFKGGAGLKAHLSDVEGASGVRILHCSRDGRKKSRGGGVAFAYDTNACNFQTRKINMPRRCCKVLCVTGNVKKINRKIVTFVVYVPPDSRAADLDDISELLTVEIAAIKASIKNPAIILCGDFNHRNITASLGDAEMLEPIITGPTRGRSKLDVIYTNVNDLILESQLLPPLRAKSGILSDHQCIYAAAEFPAAKSFKWEVKFTRKRSRKADEDFCRDIGAVDWSVVRNAEGVDAKVSTLERTIARMTDKHFPKIRSRWCSNEPPRITHRIRKLWKKKCRIYKKGGRTDAWWRTDETMQEQIKKSREESFYSATKALASPGNPSQWRVADLFSGESPSQICGKVLDYFGTIATSNVAAPRGERVWVEAGLKPFTKESTLKMLKGAKKTNSRVEGDPLPHLVREHPEAFAEPVMEIYNEINRSSEWPRS